MVVRGVVGNLLGAVELLGIELPPAGQWLLFSVLSLVALAVVRPRIVGRLRQAVGLRSLASSTTGPAKAAKVAAASFKQYREKDGQFYFKLVDAKGALLLQSLSSDQLQVSIHPSASIGTSVFLDHATGIIIGAVKENRHAEWKQEISFRDRTYPTVQEAIEAWKEANKCPPTAKAN